MKQPIQVLFILLASIALVSCEKVIDVELRTSDKKYVIEGVITDQAGRTQVRISQTKNFSGSNDFEGVNNAHVLIVEEGGANTQLSQTSPGIYESTIKGTPGKKYTLLVAIDGKEYRAVSQMPMPVSISNIYLTEMNMGSNTMRHINVVYQDPQETGNYYRFVQYINGQKEKQIFTRDDALTNGRLTTAALFTDQELKKGDVIKVELLNIDAEVYKYWYSLDNDAGSGGSASPANPATNLSGGALGYFSSHPVNEKMFVVQ
ncbi:MAG: DUF4249 domain-containing protein [Chitinophagaceae bacterium]